jgi:hypothetical protein
MPEPVDPPEPARIEEEGTTVTIHTLAGRTMHALTAAMMLLASIDALSAPIMISYDRYSGAPTIEGAKPGTEDPTSTDPAAANYSATAFFRQEVAKQTAALGADEAITFEVTAVRGSAREINATRPGIDLIVADAGQPDGRNRIGGGAFGGNFYNSMPFSELSFDQWYDYLHAGRDEGDVINKPGRGIAKANALLSARGGLQYAIPIAGSTMQGSGFFPKPVGKPVCDAGDRECLGHGDGIGLKGMCEQPWTIRYLPPAQTILDIACRSVAGPAQKLAFYPAVGGQSPRIPLQLGAIQGYEFVTPYDDMTFFPKGSNTNDVPSEVDLACNTDTNVPLTGDVAPECNQNTGQIGARYQHFPAWHQPFLTTWLLLDKESVWNRLSADQKRIILRVAKESLARSFAGANARQCGKLQAMLDFNNGIRQRDRETGEPGAVSADIVMADWPEDALDALLAARKAYLDTLRGAGVKDDEKTANQKTADSILSDLEDYAASIGATRPRAAHGVFPVNDSKLTFDGAAAVSCPKLVGR